MANDSTGLFISATDTNIGKTYYSIQILKELSKKHPLEDLAYYKPVQCGTDKDYNAVKQAIRGITTYCSYDLAFPASPHYAAERENARIDLNKIQNDYEDIKNKHKFIVIEGAGGLAVPLNKQGDLISDIAKTLKLPMVLVIRSGLGTINHSLLSLEHARNKGISILGIIVSESEPDANLNRTKNAIDTIIKLGQVEIFNPLKWKQTPTTI